VPLTPAELVRTNVKRLRALRGWTQAELASAVRRQGIAAWSPATIGLIEADRRRADHLFDMTVLCAVFQVPLSELLQLDPGELITLGPGGEPLTSGAVIAALAGTPPSFNDIQNIDDPDEMARLLGLDRGQLTFVSFDVFKNPDFLQVRDLWAVDSPRGIRGVTHDLLDQARAVLDRDGLAAVLARAEQAVMTSFKQGDLGRVYSESKPKESK
jgi:DNA-binding XRE family transcriptional regulator